jgi:biopolymer transport protein ExbB
MAGASALQKLKLERRLAYLGTLGNNAPFIGLLGTVIGIVGAFEQLGKPDSTGMAAGQTTAISQAVYINIAEALVATAVGLLIAIPAVAAFNFFQRVVKTTLSNTDALAHVLLAHLKATGTGDGRDIEGVVEHAAGRVERTSKNPGSAARAVKDGGGE